MRTPPLASRRTWLAALILLASSTSARASFLSESSIDATTRIISNYGVAGLQSGTLNPGELLAGSEARGTPTYSDVGFKFGLAGLSGKITSATFTVNVQMSQHTTGSSSTPIPLALTSFGTNTTPLTLNDFSTPPTVGITTIPVGLGAANNYQFAVSFDVTSFLGALVSIGSDGIGFQIDELLGQTGVLFGPLSNLPVANQGTLTVNYTPNAALPEPSSLVLCGLAAVVGLVGARYRRR